MWDALRSVLQMLRDNFVFDLLAVLGFALTTVGIILTYRQAQQAKSSAVDAKRAVTELRSQIRGINAVADLSAVLSGMEEIKRLLRENTWPILPERYSHMRSLLTGVRVSNSDLSEEQKSAISTAALQCRLAEQQIDRVLASNRNQQRPDFSRLDAPKLIRLLTDQMEPLEEILASLKAKIGE